MEITKKELFKLLTEKYIFHLEDVTLFVSALENEGLISFAPEKQYIYYKAFTVDGEYEIFWLSKGEMSKDKSKALLTDTLNQELVSQGYTAQEREK